MSILFALILVALPEPSSPASPPVDEASQAAAARPVSAQTFVVHELEPLGLDREQASALTAKVAEVLGRRAGVRVITVPELEAMLAHQGDLQAMGCEDEACAGRIVALAEGTLSLNGSVGRVGDGLVLSLSLVDSRAVMPLASSSRVLVSLAEAEAALPEMLDEMVGRDGGTGGGFRLPEGAAVSVAVFDIRHLGIDEAVAQNLVQVVAAEIKKAPGTRVISRDDITAMLQLQAEKSQLDCADPVCLAEIGGALGVDKLVVGHVGRLADRYLVSLRLIDVRRSEVDSRVSESFKGLEEQLLPAVRHAARNLLGAQPEGPGALAVTCSEPDAELYLDQEKVGTLPLPPLERAPGQHALRLAKADFFDWQSDVFLEPGATTAVWAQLEQRPFVWYRKWWIWTAAGVVLAGGITASVLLLQSRTATLTVTGSAPGVTP